MFKIVLVILIFSSQVSAVDFTEHDKRQHFGVSGAISFASYKILRYNGMNKVDSAVGAFLGTLIVGALKEASDDYVDREDLKADAIGAVSGILFSWGVEF